jgi:hypothetical protein
MSMYYRGTSHREEGNREVEEFVQGLRCDRNLAAGQFQPNWRAGDFQEWGGPRSFQAAFGRDTTPSPWSNL